MYVRRLQTWGTHLTAVARGALWNAMRKLRVHRLERRRRICLRRGIWVKSRLGEWIRKKAGYSAGVIAEWECRRRATRRSVGHAGTDGYERDRGDRSACASWHGNAREDYGTRSSSQYGYRRSGASGYRSSYAGAGGQGALERAVCLLRSVPASWYAALACIVVLAVIIECDCPQRRCCG